MKISAKTEYACLAMMELAWRSGSGEPVRIRDIAESHTIPPRFLVQILLQLRNGGLVTSTRGAAGGYQLAHDPAEISLWSIIEIVEGRESGLHANSTDMTTARHALISAWEEVVEIEQNALDKIRLSDLVERLRDEDNNMYFI